MDREVELARILSAIKARNIANVVWISADVQLRRGDALRSGARRVQGLHSFWELIAGPMHAKTFPAEPLDDTFGPGGRNR